MKRRQFETSNRFLLDTAEHRLTIIREDGVYRHLRIEARYALGHERKEIMA